MGIGSRIKRAVSKATAPITNPSGFNDLMTGHGEKANREYKTAYSKTEKQSKRKGTMDAIEMAAYGIYGEQAKRYISFGADKGAGYSKEEGDDLGAGLGVNYQQVEGDRQQRKLETDAQRKLDADSAEYRRKADLEDRKQRGQVASRVRRSARADKPGTKGGTLTSGGLGSAGGGQLSFASLLGL